MALRSSLLHRPEALRSIIRILAAGALQLINNVALPGQHIIVGSSIGAWIALKPTAARRERIRVRGVQATTGHCCKVPVLTPGRAPLLRHHGKQPSAQQLLRAQHVTHITAGAGAAGAGGGHHRAAVVTGILGWLGQHSTLSSGGHARHLVCCTSPCPCRCGFAFPCMTRLCKVGSDRRGPSTTHCRRRALCCRLSASC
jgi:hypothetical protein